MTTGMQAAPRIAIPEPTLDDKEYNQRSWPQYARAVEASGGVAVKIPLDAAPAEVARLASGCQAVLLPGSGADVNPEKYGEEPIAECGRPDPAREAVDELLMQDAANLHKPLFGICYGLQAWNVWRGGALVQDLVMQTATPVNHKPGREVRDAHAVRIAPGSKLAGIVHGSRLTVNSSHHQALAKPGDGLATVAWSADDEVIEAVEGIGDQFVLGVQWHPERTADDPASRALFDAFLTAARQWQPRVIHESVVSASMNADPESAVPAASLK
jgi:putative glutamine amidotransferase